MTLTFVQKIQFLVIRTIVSILWLFDVTAYATFGNRFFSVAKVGAITSLILLFSFSLTHRLSAINYVQNVKYLHTGINFYIYGDSTLGSLTPFTENNVLGTRSVGGVVPVLKETRAFPYITAKAHLIIDNNSKTILSEHNIKRSFAPASTTKLMTALVTLDLYKLDEEVKVLQECTLVDSTKLWLLEGDTFLVKDFLYSLLVSSAGDVGCTLAASKVSVENFVSLMNEKAVNIGMNSTHFTNAIGLDGENGSHYSSVWDLYILSEKIMENTLLREIVNTELYSFTPVNKPKTNVNIENTNKLLSQIPESIGIKTGRTDGAGEVLIYRYKELSKDLTIIVMSSDDRFSDTRKLLDWALESYSWDK
ncbi:D-alanyl-D-alanine carboxypeptidase family protein [Patescibacteria group bacterium]